MKRSTERILTTHTGSMPQPAGIIELLFAEQNDQEFDRDAFERLLPSAVAEVVRQQAEQGVDVVTDGEFGKTSWTNYVIERFTGLERVLLDPSKDPPGPQASYDRRRFADFYQAWAQALPILTLPPEVVEQRSTQPPVAPGRWMCTGPLSSRGHAAIQRDIQNLQGALDAVDVEEAFLPLAGPASVEASVRNAHYPSDEEYLTALADALKQEYRAVVDAGLLLQVDDAFIPYNYDIQMLRSDTTMAEYLAHCELRVEITNYALEGIPEDRIRYHICWGSWAGPHSSDVELKDIVHLLLKINAQAYSVEAANPRHEHEWMVWESVKLPDGKILIPGVVSQKSNVIEHPDLVAWRLRNYARLVGRENVMAGTDCGFQGRIHQSLAWPKLAAMAEGARRASEELWNGS